MTEHLTWHESGGTHYGKRSGATVVRLSEVNWGITDPDFPILFVSNWDAPTPEGWYADEREPYEWRGTRGRGRTVAERDEIRNRLLAEAKAAQERTFARWAGLMGLMPVEALTLDPERGDRLVTDSGRVEV